MASALVAAVSWLLVAVAPTSAEFQISDYCIRCLCEAVSGGPFCAFGGQGCHDGVCGPYSITLPYWQDGGRPTVGLQNRDSVKTYERCAQDPACAEATVRGYMTRFHQDCNGDGVEDCLDYAAIHFHGGYGCNKPLGVPAKNTLNACLQKQVQPPQPKPVDPQPVGPFPNPDSPGPENPAPEVPFPDAEEPLNPNHNIVYPNEPTTFPPIDVRFGGS